MTLSGEELSWCLVPLSDEKSVTLYDEKSVTLSDEKSVTLSGKHLHGALCPYLICYSVVFLVPI